MSINRSCITYLKTDYFGLTILALVLVQNYYAFTPTKTDFEIEHLKT